MKLKSISVLLILLFSLVIYLAVFHDKDDKSIAVQHGIDEIDSIELVQGKKSVMLIRVNTHEWLLQDNRAVDYNRIKALYQVLSGLRIQQAIPKATRDSCVQSVISGVEIKVYGAENYRYQLGGDKADSSAVLCQFNDQDPVFAYVLGERVLYNEVVSVVPEKWLSPLVMDLSAKKITALEWLKLDPEEEVVDGKLELKISATRIDLLSMKDDHKIDHSLLVSWLQEINKPYYAKENLSPEEFNRLKGGPLTGANIQIEGGDRFMLSTFQLLEKGGLNTKDLLVVFQNKEGLKSYFKCSYTDWDLLLAQGEEIIKLQQ